MNGALHTERQSASWWVHAAMLVAVGSSVAVVLPVPGNTSRWWIAVPIALPLVIYGLFTPMTVEVSAEAMVVRFGDFGWPRWVFPVAEISNARAVQFRPLRDFGGWGIRRGRDAYCLNQRGDRGVRFAFIGRDYVVGSDDPERLLAALRTAGAGTAD